MWAVVAMLSSVSTLEQCAWAWGGDAPRGWARWDRGSRYLQCGLRNRAEVVLKILLSCLAWNEVELQSGPSSTLSLCCDVGWAGRWLYPSAHYVE